MHKRDTSPGDFPLRFTQNFLRSRALVEKLVRLANIQPGETVLEIGPGKGIITAELAKVVGDEGRVVAVELDTALLPALQARFAAEPQVSIVHQDILQMRLRDLGRPYAIFSNVPFNITSELLTFLFAPGWSPQTAHLILQRDALVGTTRNGQPSETLKSLLIKPFYDVSMVYQFAKSDFLPSPTVDTALFAFRQRDTPRIREAHYGAYCDFLAYVSRDRVGEGAWLKVLTKRQLAAVAQRSDLTLGRGLKAQSLAAVLAAFDAFLLFNERKKHVVSGAMAKLREEQVRREKLNRAGGHHRSKSMRKEKRRGR